MSFFSSLFSRLFPKAYPKYLEHVPFGKFGQVYGGFVGVCTILGTLQGAYRWACWFEDAKPIPIENELLYGPVNISRYAGRLCWELFAGFSSSFLISLTAPGSVPLIVYLEKKSKKNDSPPKSSDDL